MFLNQSHAVFATADVARITAFWRAFMDMEPHFENKGFSEFVLPSGYRFAFFLPTGTAGKHFSAAGTRNASSSGLTVVDVDEVFNRLLVCAESHECSHAGAPKEHPWGEKSFLMVDPDGNKWEITQSPTKDGRLVNRE